MLPSPLALLTQAQAEPLLHKGAPCRLVLHPPEEPVAALLADQGLHSLPPDLAELLEHCQTITIEQDDNWLEHYEFTTAGYSPAEMLVPHCLWLADYDGNGYLLEANPTHSSGPVWFASHDPEVLILEASTLHEFLDRTIDGYRPTPRYSKHPWRSMDLNTLLFRVNDAPLPGQLALRARNSPDPAIAAFAQSLPESAVIFDLRNLAPGDGISFDHLDYKQPCRFSSNPLLRAAFTKHPSPYLP